MLRLVCLGVLALGLFEEDESKPGWPTAKAINAAMAQVKPAVIACGAVEGAPLATVFLTVEPTGVVRATRAERQYAGTPQGRCMENAAKKAVFPRFEGNPKGTPMELRYPFMMRR